MIDPTHIDLPQFLATWFGPPAAEAKPLPESCNWLPASLRDWHALISRWDEELAFTTRMTPPERIAVEDGKAVFMSDCGGEWCWSFDPAMPGSVFNAEIYEPWEQDSETMSEFLVHRTIMEVLSGASTRMRASMVSDEHMEYILDSAEEVAFGAWSWPVPGYRTFMRGDVLMQIIRCDDGPGWDVDIAAPEVGMLSRFREMVDVKWLG
ncbi:hypothetical protein [Streptomyces sp. NRRL WC-3742]|uniref:hypothetical protein n=1 Tax=Streptomyces sp. NRRL WC-3742 TaxID=1463934 RepID=UPI00131E3A95|nr:hypothetical protein [Streptomyces sp. NRRL WC-3742]